MNDAEANYSYDDWALVELDGQFYWLHTSGCSCPSPTETWGVFYGPVSLSEARQLMSDWQDEWGVPARQKQEFLDLCDQALKEG